MGRDAVLLREERTTHTAILRTASRHSRLESSESLPWKVQTSQVHHAVILFAISHSLEKSLKVITEEEK